MAKQTMWARRPFQYGNGEEAELDRGQVFDLVGERLDEKLVRLGYCAPLEKGSETFECGACGKKFVDEGARRGHGDRRHSQRADRLVTEAQIEREEARLNAEAPLYLEKTAASARG